jgi:hypothetical protein
MAMHEVSLFENVVAPVEQNRQKQTFTGVNRIRMKVQALGCVEPDSLRFCLNAVTRGTSVSRLAGQPDLTRKGDKRWAPAARDGLCRLYGVTACGSALAIADSGNDRGLLWEAAP